MDHFFERYADRIIPEPNSGCWLWCGSQIPKGYGTLTSGGASHYAHRAAYECAHGKGTAQGHVIRHQCDQPCCVNPDHLLSGTNRDNSQDAVRRGRMRAPRGEKNAKAKITDAQALNVAHMARSGMTATEIANATAISRPTIYTILKGANWRHLDVAVPDRRRTRVIPPYGTGEDCPRAVLTRPQVVAIRARLASGEKGSALAREYSVSQATISSIKVRRNWGHV